jgi:glycosyltransferase involved in cell wall biosynthesis
VGFGRAKVRYIDSEYIARPIFKFAKLLRGGTETSWTTAIALSYPSYLTFEWEAWRATRDEIRAGAFDVVHRITPMSPTLPSPMASWSSAPFVLGPLNGGLKWPLAFREELAREREWLSYVRDAYRLIPYQHSTYKRAAVVLAAFQHTIDDLPKHAQMKVINFPEVGLDPEVFSQTTERRARKQKVILFAGRFVPYKLPQVVLRAFAERVALQNHRLVMIGDGPERPTIEQLIRSYGLEGKVELLGWKTQAEVAAFMREADIFAFPSIRELGAGVVVEAMACGLACIVVNYGGPGTLIDAGRGVKVPLGNKDHLIRSFGHALEFLVADEYTTIRLGAAARQHALRYYTWDTKARKMLEVYKWVLGRGPRPEFWTPE